MSLETRVASPHNVGDLNGLRSRGVCSIEELLHGLNITAQTLLWMLRSGVKLKSDTVGVGDRQRLFPECRDELVTELEGR